ncbi:MAG: hypothetical protein MIO92_01540 [Methanosarcinaceae archaeon]|nr:hypothetical protein [Methanosarcinaceae archaeon]
MKKKAGVIFLTILTCLVLLELGLRALGRRPTNMADGIAEQYGDSFKLKKNVTKHFNYPAYSYTVHTNAYGFRDKAAGPKDLTSRPFFAFLGASDVFGNGVDFEETFVGIFAQEALKRGSEVINLAVGGHYFLDQEYLFRDFMESTHLKPSTVFLCVNALHIPKFDRRNLNIIVKSGYPIDKEGWRIAYLRLLAGNNSSAFCFFRDGIRKIQERYLNYERTEKSPEFLQIYSKSNNIRQQERTKQFYEYLTTFDSYCRENGIKLVIVYSPLSDSFNLKEMARKLGTDPENYDVSFYEELIILYCRSKGIKLINIRPALERAYNDGKEIRFKLDPHFNKYANRVIGEFLTHDFFQSYRE